MQTDTAIQRLRLPLRKQEQHNLRRATWILLHSPLSFNCTKTRSIVKASALLAPPIIHLLRDSASRQAIGVVFPFATATSICRSRLTIRSGVCFFPRAIPRLHRSSFSHLIWYKKCRALQQAQSLASGPLYARVLLAVQPAPHADLNLRNGTGQYGQPITVTIQDPGRVLNSTLATAELFPRPAGLPPRLDLRAHLGPR